MAKMFRLPPALGHAAIASFFPASRCNSYRCTRFLTTAARMASCTGRSYADALALLENLQSNRSVVTSISTSPFDMNQAAIPEMLDWTRKAGYEVGDFAKHGLRCIHIAGTKGKGSVCAMVEKLLLQYRGEDACGGLAVGARKSLGKIGMYTSPHLITVRERIHIDGSPISERLFARYFFELWDRFSNSVPDSDPMSLDTKPSYFRYLTILALHVFLQEGVETAIMECGIGGEYDSTNILPPEAVTVCAIARLGIDHIGMLGETIEEIAWHKAGIIKTGTPVFTIEQVPAAHAVLKKRAAEKGVELQVVKQPKAVDNSRLGIDLSMEGDFQQTNAALSTAVAASHLMTMGITEGIPKPQALPVPPESLPEQFKYGLKTAKLPGRCEVRKDGNIEWLIDGAHTVDSIEAVAQWFTSKVDEAWKEEKPPTATMLIFNQQDRDAEALLRTLITSIARAASSKNGPRSHRSFPTAEDGAQSASKIFTYAAFCTNTPFKDDVGKDVDLSLQERLAEVYNGMQDGNSTHMCYGNVEEAVEFARKVSAGEERVLVLVTGSLYLVGGLMKVLEKQAGSDSDSRRIDR